MEENYEIMKEYIQLKLNCNTRVFGEGGNWWSSIPKYRFHKSDKINSYIQNIKILLLRFCNNIHKQQNIQNILKRVKRNIVLKLNKNTNNKYFKFTSTWFNLLYFSLAVCTAK